VSKERPRNVAASVRQRLLTQSREQGEEFQLVLTRYALERLLYRVGQSPHRDVFVLKGAMLFRLWTQQLHRPTKDLDLLGYGELSVERFETIFREVCGLVVEDDGLRFDPASVHGGRIKEDQEYEGLRIGCVALLERARIPLQIDIGFGDAVTPAAMAVEFPTMLDFPAPSLRAYPRQTVVAEKYQAMVALGIANSRMKDFYDLWVLARQFAFAGTTLAGAIRATFDRRKTALPDQPPLAWTPAFYDDASKKQQWQGFLKKSKLEAGGATLEQVCLFLSGFLMPPTLALCSGEAPPRSWPPAGPWSPGQEEGNGAHG
jgi:predicted nucleotidyltransferase component of viral defense system